MDRNTGRAVCRLGARTVVLLRLKFLQDSCVLVGTRVGVWDTSESGLLLVLVNLGTYRNAAALASSRLGKLPVRPVSGPGHRAPRSSCRGQPLAASIRERPFPGTKVNLQARGAGRAAFKVAASRGSAERRALHADFKVASGRNSHLQLSLGVPGGGESWLGRSFSRPLCTWPQCRRDS